VKAIAAIEWRRRVWIAYLAAGGLLTAAYMWVPPLKGNGPLINLLGLSSSIAIAVGIYLHRPRARAAWLLFIVGQFLFFAGDLYTYSYPKLFGADVEFPSLGDAIYLTVYPALVAGLLILVRRRNPQGDRAGVIGVHQGLGMRNHTVSGGWMCGLNTMQRFFNHEKHERHEILNQFFGSIISP
jgi:hypothetical protein